jgi:hypothetical protein
MFQTKVVQKIKMHFLIAVTVFFENRAAYEKMWKKYCGCGHAIDYNIAHTRYMPNKNNNNNNNNNNNIFIYCNCVVTRWQWLFYIYTKHEICY